MSTDRLKEGRPAIIVIRTDGTPWACRELRGPGFRVVQAEEGVPRPDGCPHVWLEIDEKLPLEYRNPEGLL